MPSRSIARAAPHRKAPPRPPVTSTPQVKKAPPGRRRPGQPGHAEARLATRTPRDPLIWALIAIAGLVFARSLGQGFSPWDDSIAVYANPYLNPVTLAHVARFWTQPYQGLYIPLAYTLFSGIALVSHSATVDPASGSHFQAAPFHLANLTLHCANVVLVYLILRMLVRRDIPALLGALLFGLHPLQVESVAWIPELRGLSSAFFCLLATCLYLSYARAHADDRHTTERLTYYALAMATGVLAMLCKPSAISLPLLLFALDRWCLRRPTAQCLRSSAIFLLPAGLIVLLTRAAQPVAAGLATPFLQRPFVAGDALAFYLVKLVAPFPLAIDYGRTPGDVLSHWWGHVTWLLPATLAVWIWLKRASAPWLVAAGVVGLAALLPNLGLIPFIFQHYSTVADRYAYLALLSPALALAYLLARIQLPLARSVAATVLVCLAVVSVVQQGY